MPSVPEAGADWAVVGSKPAPATMLIFQLLPTPMLAPASKMMLSPACNDSEDGAAEAPDPHVEPISMLLAAERLTLPLAVLSAPSNVIPSEPGFGCSCPGVGTKLVPASRLM